MSFDVDKLPPEGVAGHLLMSTVQLHTVRCQIKINECLYNVFLLILSRIDNQIKKYVILLVIEYIFYLYTHVNTLDGLGKDVLSSSSWQWPIQFVVLWHAQSLLTQCNCIIVKEPEKLYLHPSNNHMRYIFLNIIN